MRNYSYVTIGKILERLHNEGLKISRPTLKSLMKKELLFQMKKTHAGWYVCNEEQLDLILKLVKQNYGK